MSVQENNNKKPRTSSAPLPKTDLSKLNKTENLLPFRNSISCLKKSKKQSITYDTWCQSNRTRPSKGTEMLLTGFGMRNVDSLQNALRKSEQERREHFFEYLKKLQITHSEQEDLEAFTPVPISSAEDVSTSEVTAGSSIREQYLMEIESLGEEEDEVETEKQMENKPGIDLTSEAMKQAQYYLEDHRIFEFFKFLLAHMLSAIPDNPVQFLVEILDKCLIYRFGSGNPPVLYEKHHLEQLFHLMDRMDTGFIEPQQYKTAMATLNIQHYNKNPPLSTDGMVNKDMFITEAHKRLVEILNDLIEPRP